MAEDICVSCLYFSLSQPNTCPIYTHTYTYYDWEKTTTQARFETKDDMGGVAEQ